jgi:hypothetical protein
VQARNIVIGLPNTSSGVSIFAFQDASPYFPERNLRISGVTYDSAGNVLPNCIVKLIQQVPPDRCVFQTVSDSGGNYVVDLPVGFSQSNTKNYYIVAYLHGSPDVFGTTVNTLTGA